MKIANETELGLAGALHGAASAKCFWPGHEARGPSVVAQINIKYM